MPRPLNWGRVIFLMVVVAIICAFSAYQLLHFKSEEKLRVQNTNSSTSHFRLTPFPEQKIFLGFISDGQAYADASDFCEQPDFKSYVEDLGQYGASQAEGTWALVKNPKIALPPTLAEKSWSVISVNESRKKFTLSTPYQILGLEGNSNSCLYIGEKNARSNVQNINFDRMQPAIILMGMTAAPGTKLKPHEDTIEITKENRSLYLSVYPWLEEWLNEFGRDDSSACGSEDGYFPLARLHSIEGEVIKGNSNTTYWIAATGCETLDNWNLVVSNGDGSMSFVSLNRPKSGYDYTPGKVWTVRMIGDENIEFLIYAQYYEGSSYVLLKLIGNEKSGYQLKEIASTAYEGL